MPAASQHPATAPKRVKTAVHALHGAFAFANTAASFASEAENPETGGENLVAALETGLVECAANSQDADGWMLLAPKGSHPHPRGLQLIDDASIANMVSRFSGAWQRVRRAILGGSASLPVYHGHPDDAAFASEHDDTTRYGEVTALQARADGLYGKIEWTAAGNALRGAGDKLFFSPRWLVRPVAGSTAGLRHYRAVKLLSLGLTATPNIAGAAANEQTQPKIPNTMLKRILIALGFAEAQAAAAAANEAGAPSEYDVIAKVEKLKADLSAANAAKAKAEQDLSAANAAKAKAEADLTTANAVRDAAAGVVIAQAVKVGVITTANADAEQALLLGHADFAAAANGLLARPAVISTQPKVGAEGRNAEGVLANAEAATREFRGKVEEIQAQRKCDYPTAWSNAKAKYPDLYKQMEAKEGK